MTEPEDKKDEAPKRSRLFLWFLAGCIPVLVLALIFATPLRCLLEFRITDRFLTLLIALVAAVAGGLGLVLPLKARQIVWSVGGGVALALAVIVLVDFALPTLPPDQCSIPTPIPDTPTPTLVPTDTPEPTDTPVPEVWRCKDSTAGALYVASDESDKFHCLDCEWAGKISKWNRICFSSYQAALDAGYQPCQVCEPP